jgi:hypothetical protein
LSKTQLLNSGKGSEVSFFRKIFLENPQNWRILLILLQYLQQLVALKNELMGGRNKDNAAV